MKYNGFSLLMAICLGFVIGAAQASLLGYWWICTIIMFFVGLFASAIESKLYGKD